MSPARIAALDSIQFDWNIWGHQRLQVHQDAWDAMYNKLVEYMKKHGHGNVSQHAGKRKNRQCVVGGGEDDGGGVREGDEELEEEERLGKWIKNQLSTCETSIVGIFVASSFAKGTQLMYIICLFPMSPSHPFYINIFLDATNTESIMSRD